MWKTGFKKSNNTRTGIPWKRLLVLSNNKPAYAKLVDITSMVINLPLFLYLNKHKVIHCCSKRLTVDLRKSDFYINLGTLLIIYLNISQKIKAMTRNNLSMYTFKVKLNKYIHV